MFWASDAIVILLAALPYAALVLVAAQQSSPRLVNYAVFLRPDVFRFERDKKMFRFEVLPHNCGLISKPEFFATLH